MDFTDKIVVVTGGAEGIGRAIVENFSLAGAKVAVIDQKPLSYECDFYFQGDLGEKETLAAFGADIIERYGKIDFLINNAALSRKGILSSCSYEDFMYVQQVGVGAPYFLTMLFQDFFNEGGSVINIASTRWNQSQPDTESYSASKGGIVALTHALAVSLAGKVRVNAISPGWINTHDSKFSDSDRNQHLAKRVGRPEDIVNMVKFLCSEDSSFITGQNFTVDGGMSKQMIYHGDHGWEYKE